MNLMTHAELTTTTTDVLFYATGSCVYGTVLVARSIGGGRVNVVGLRLPEEEDEPVPLTRTASFKQKLAELWSSVAGI